MRRLQAKSLRYATESLSSAVIFCIDWLTSADIIKSLPDDYAISVQLCGECNCLVSVKLGPWTSNCCYGKII